MQDANIIAAKKKKKKQEIHNKSKGQNLNDRYMK